MPTVPVPFSLARVLLTVSLPACTHMSLSRSRQRQPRPGVTTPSSDSASASQPSQQQHSSAILTWLDDLVSSSQHSVWDADAAGQRQQQLRINGGDAAVRQADRSSGQPPMNNGDALRILLPLLIVLSTLLFVLLIFLVCVLFLRKRRGIALSDNDGPIDMSREDIIDGEGGFDAIEANWLESESDETRRAYRRAKGARRRRLVGRPHRHRALLTD